MKKNNIYLDIHAIQAVPPSNINRDDTGSPKTAQYGGVTRSRVSSQSWKKAMRDYFKKYDTNKNIVGKRSLRLNDYIADKIVALKNEIGDEEALKLATEVLKNAGVSSKDDKLKALFFISNKQADALAKAAVEGETRKDILETLINEEPALDMALFGRMLADNPSLNEDASSQVAHSISTHAIQTEFDFFTATDDLSLEDNAGAGMLGTVEFNSSTLYRYANVAVHELFKQLNCEKELTIESLKLFINSFVKSMPTGNINSFANQTLPQALIVTIREDRPINLVTAFETPVKSNDGYIQKSIDKLKAEYYNVFKFVDKPLVSLSVGIEEVGEEQEDLDKLVEEFASKLSSLLD